MRPSPALPAVAFRAAFAAPVAAVLALTGCAPASEPMPAESATATASATATPAPAPATSPPAETVAAPEECASIDVQPGGTVPGAELGACLQATLVRHDTGTLTLTGDELAGRVQYRYDPAFEFRADLETGDGPVALSFVDDVMQLDQGDGPVVGDRESDDPAEQMAGTTGELYRVFSDPGFMGDLIRAGDTWTVGAATEDVSLPDGDVVTAWRVDSSAPFSWYEIPIDSYSVWFTDEWAPVSASSTSGFLGRTTTITQQFTGLGEPVSIDPLD